MESVGWPGSTTAPRSRARTGTRPLILMAWTVFAMPLAGCEDSVDHLSPTQGARPEHGTAEAERFAATAAAVTETIKPCWAIDPDEPATPVGVIVTVEPGGTVSQAQVEEPERYATDPQYRAAADRAIAAVMNPHCQPLPFPSEGWPDRHEVRMNFDPADTASR